MEPIRKRQKVANEQQRSFLIDQPDLFLEVVVSFWDFQSLLAFRQTNHRFKRIVEEDLKRRSLESLPIDCNDEDYDHGRFDRASLHLEWSEQFRDRDAVYEHALTRADPGGQVSLDADYDEDRARYLIHSRGWVDVEDFLGDSDADTAEEDYYCSEIGWKVSASFRSISPEKKWNIAKAILINEDGVSMFEDYEANRKFLRQCAFGLLLDAQPSSLRHTCAKYRYRHTDYPAGGKEEALLFLTSDGTQVQLKGLTFAFSIRISIRVALLDISFLPELYTPTLHNLQRDHNNSDNEVVPNPDGETVARILSHMRQKVAVDDDNDDSTWDVGKCRRSLEPFLDTPRLQVLIVATASPTNLWIRCIQHWQRYQLWNRFHFRMVDNKQGNRMNPLWLIPRP